MGAISSGFLRFAWDWLRATEAGASRMRTWRAWSPRRPWAMPNSTRVPALRVVTPWGSASERGLGFVATGTNADDAVAGFRPGIRAAAERGAITPLLDAGLTKEQVREASRRWGLPTWDKPAAACLSSRVAYGIEVTPFRLARVERAEAACREMLAEAGIPVRDLRVRDLGERASVEVDAPLLLDQLAPGTTAAGALLDAVRRSGFAAADLDPKGFRSGSMNEALLEH